MEVGGHLIRSNTSRQTHQEVRTDVPRPHLTQTQHPEVTWVVTSQDVENKQTEVDALQFDMETVDLKYRRLTNDRLEEVIPGYKERQEKRKEFRPHTVGAVPSVTQAKSAAKTCAKSTALAAAERRVSQKHHNQSCDARLRGWHGANTYRGHHYVLVEPSYDDTLQGQMMCKMHHERQREVQLPDFLHRYNSTGHNRAPCGKSVSQTLHEKEAGSERSDATTNASDVQKGKKAEREQKASKKSLRRLDSVDDLSTGDKKLQASTFKKGLEEDIDDVMLPAVTAPARMKFSIIPEVEEEEEAAEETPPSPSARSDASFRSMDITFNDEVRHLADRGPKWLDGLLRHSSGCADAISKTPGAYERIAARYSGQISNEFQRKLTANVVF